MQFFNLLSFIIKPNFFSIEYSIQKYSRIFLFSSIDLFYNKIDQILKTENYKNSELYNTYKTYQCTI